MPGLRSVVNERAEVLPNLCGRAWLSDIYIPTLLLVPRKACWAQVMVGCARFAEAILKPSWLPSLPVQRPLLRNSPKQFLGFPATDH